MSTSQKPENVVVIIGADAEIHGWMLLVKAGDELRQELDCETVQGGDMDAAGILAVEIAEVGLHDLIFVQRFLGVAQHDLAGRRQSQPVGKALE